MRTLIESKTRKVLAAVLVLVLVITSMPIAAALRQPQLLAAQEWTVTFDPNGGNWDGCTNDLEVTVEDDSLVRKPESPEKYGYVFVHWFTGPAFTDARWRFQADRVTADVTVYAMWAEVETYDWVLVRHETFDRPFTPPAEWTIDDHSNMSHPVWGSNGIGFHNREVWMQEDRRGNANTPGAPSPVTIYPGESFADRLANMNEFRREHTYGEGGWLSIREYTRSDDITQLQPENAGGRFEIVDGRARVIAEHVYDAALISNTDPLPPVYRIQITVSNIDAGGRNIDPATGREINNSDNSIAAWTDTDGVYNGLRNLEPGTNPWRPNMDTNAVGSTGSTNGMYFLAIGDYFNPMPNNNDFIHHRRKIAMDVNSHRSDPWSGIWCPEEERHVMDGSRYVSMIWLTDAWRTANVAPENGGWGAGTPLTPGPASGQWLGGPHTTITVNTGTMGWGQRNTWLNNGNPFYTYTQVGRHYGAWDTFMVDKYLPDEAYIFTVERTPEYFRLSVSGYFAIGGETTYTHTKFHLPDNDPTSPRFNMGQGTWRFNQTPEELQGWEPHSAIVRFENANTGEYLYYETWPTDTGNPCFFFFGLPHVQHYIATADFDDLKLWVAEEYAYRFPADPSWTTPDPGPGTGGGGGGGGGPLPTPTPPAPDYELHLAYMFGNAQGNFRPTANLTRAEAATILARTQLLEFEEGISTLPPGMTSFTAFSDVQPNNWFFYYVAWAYDADLVQGSGGRFRPNDPVTREEFAAMMARTMDVRPAGALPFPDAGSISNWARAYVYTVYRAGVMVGDAQGNFNPDANISRAEVATAMNRVLGRIDSRAALYAADVENLAHARRFPDVATTTWYFPSVVAAANDHRLTRDDDGAIDWKEIIR